MGWAFSELPPRKERGMSEGVLDVCCGSRMFWFDRKDARAVYCDNRQETHELRDRSSKGGSLQRKQKNEWAVHLKFGLKRPIERE